MKKRPQAEQFFLTFYLVLLNMIFSFRVVIFPIVFFFGMLSLSSGFHYRLFLFFSFYIRLFVDR